VKTVHGWAFPDADRFMANEMKPDGRYQSSHLDAALAHVSDFSCAIDGGAHVGTWSKMLSGRFGRVVAVEPSWDTFECLNVNMQRFACENVDTLNVALGAKRGFVSMAPLDERAEDLANTGARFVQPGGSIVCEAIDDWNLPSLGFLKLDVEGSEVDALTGAAFTLTRCKPVVLFECKGFWRRFGHAKDAPHTLLLSLGYYEAQVVGCDRIWKARP